MGDKSPKALQRTKKQDTADKMSKQAAAIAKAAPPVRPPPKKGK